MGKIGILSMQRIKNYGSFLQAYALKNMISDLGYEVEFVDYHIEKPIINEVGNKKFDKVCKGLKALQGDAPIKQKIQYIIHKTNFSKKYLNLLGISSEYNYNPQLDTLIIGSDEVFNCIQSNKNVGYSLELFGKNNNANKVITYAASFGNTTLKKLKDYKKDKEITEYLNKMDSISVRDDNSGNIVKSLTKKEISYNLDPVLIFDYMSKDNLIPNIKPKEKYMLVYAYSGRIKKDESSCIRNFANERGIKIYSIGGAQKCADKFIDCTPFELFSYFKNAEYVITDTFHGTIFSIVTHKPFVTLVRKSIGNNYGNEEKLTDLLNRLKLTDRIIYDIKKTSSIIDEIINYDDVEKILKVEREKSLKYLEENLKNKSSLKHIKNNEMNCCGCSACYNICPKKAITMVEDEYGFIYPKIDADKCINCGLCTRVCDYKKEHSKIKNDDCTAYLGINNNEERLLKSSSGGIFIALAERTISEGGIVYGSAMDNFECHHIRVTDRANLSKLQGSKYVQSSIGDIYSQVKTDLENNKKVLFSGTPCQIGGLNGYLLGKKYDNLMTVDIICHGVPNNKFFKDYIKNLEQKKDIKVNDFTFRDKTRGGGYNAKVVYKNKKLIVPSYTSSYYQLFLDSVICRENCYTCQYAGTKRVSDITIGDYWGAIEEHAVELKNKSIINGVSCILINSNKGQKFIDSLNDELFVVKSTYEKVSKHNKQLISPSKKSVYRSYVMSLYKDDGYNEVDKWYKKKCFIKNSLKIVRDFFKNFERK